MLDLHFFENPRFSAASGAITLTFFALFGTLFLLTQYLQAVLGYSTVKAGAVLLPQAAVLMICAPLSSVWVQRFGNKLVVTTGLTIMTASLLSVDLLDEHSSTAVVIVVTMLLGLGMANIMAPATDSIMGSLPRAKAGVGSAVNDTTRQMGGALGVAVLGSLLASRYSSAISARLGPVLPHRLFDLVDNNVGQAVSVAHQSPQAHAFTAQIVAAANTSFVQGLHLAFTVAACVTTIAAVGVYKFLPARHRELAEAEVVGGAPAFEAALD
jgi:Na+/melibiose symporter-like transporter